MTMSTCRILLGLVLLAAPLFASAHGAYYGYYGPPQFGYLPRPVYPYAYAPRPYLVQPFAYGGYHRPHAWRQFSRGHRLGGWRGGPYGRAHRGPYGTWGGGWGGGHPRRGFSFHYFD